jgi:hypothetical protein
MVDVLQSEEQAVGRALAVFLGRIVANVPGIERETAVGAGGAIGLVVGRVEYPSAKGQL